MATEILIKWKNMALYTCEDVLQAVKLLLNDDFTFLHRMWFRKQKKTPKNMPQCSILYSTGPTSSRREKYDLSNAYF